MTDRVQEMLDVVKQELETAIKRPRRRRAKVSMRAEVREGILKSPHISQGTGPTSLMPGSRSFQAGQTGYSEPRHPDVWRDGSIAGRDQPDRSRGRPKIDPAEAALAAFQAAKTRSPKRSSRRSVLDSLSLDRPRMDGEQIKSRRRASKGRTILRKRTDGDAPADSREEPKNGDIGSEKRRGGWLRALTGSRRGR